MKTITIVPTTGTAPTTVFTVVETIQEEFNWLTVLRALVDGGYIDSSSYSLIYKFAGDWPTCACGQLCKQLPRGPNGAPKDRHTFILGDNFATAVANRNWEEALSLFKSIEERTNELLNGR